jgi:hypothetical protein
VVGLATQGSGTTSTGFEASIERIGHVGECGVAKRSVATLGKTMRLDDSTATIQRKA